MIYVTITQLVGILFVGLSVYKDELMISQENEGVKCDTVLNVTIGHFHINHAVNVTASYLAVYWGWKHFELRWNINNQQGLRLTLMETYEVTHKISCEETYVFHTQSPSVAPIPTKHPNLIPPPSPTPKPTKTTGVPTKVPTNSSNNTYIHNYYDYINETIKNKEYIPTIRANINKDITRSPTKETRFPTLPTPHPTRAPTNKTLAPVISPTKSQQGCDDLEIVKSTGKLYFILMIAGILCTTISLLLSIFISCYLVIGTKRAKLKIIIIGLSVTSFMIYLMAFAVWIAYFSESLTNVLTNGQINRSFVICLLGNPTIGVSVIYLLIGWLLIGLSTISSCYCTNKPRQWYQFVRLARPNIYSDPNQKDSLDSLVNNQHQNSEIVNSFDKTEYTSPYDKITSVTDVSYMN